MINTASTALKQTNYFRHIRRSVWLLSFVEMWERFSYYGMRALLVLYLTSQLGFSDESSYGIYSSFAAIGYAGPVVFGTLADRIFGFRYMIIFGGVIMALGHLLMTITEMQPNLIYLGLTLIAVGTGAFKGNITNLLGKCYKDSLVGRDEGFSIFYICTNLGSAAAAALCGIVARKYGWHYGFGLAGIGMLIGLVTFLSFQHILGNTGRTPMPNMQIPFKFQATLILVVIAAVLGISWFLNNDQLFSRILQIFGVIALVYYFYNMFQVRLQYRTNLLVILVLVFFFCLFFALEMQLGSLINLFTQRNIDKTILGFEVPAAISQALNPLSIIIFGPLINYCFKFNTKNKFARFSIGLSTTSICFAILYLGCLHAQDGVVDYSYLLFGMIAMGIGELLIGPFIQSQVSFLSPGKQQGFIMGMVMLALTFSNILGGEIAKLMSVSSGASEENPLLSLPIYQEGFKRIALGNGIVVIAFLSLIPFLRRSYARIDAMPSKVTMSDK